MRRRQDARRGLPPRLDPGQEYLDNVDGLAMYQQDDFARKLVADGHDASLSAVVQRGLELMRSEAERKQTDFEVLRAFFAERASGLFVTSEEGRQRTKAMIASKRRAGELGCRSE